MTIPNEFDPVRELAAVLREAGASARVRPERIARSTLYDLDYHVALIASVFFIAARDEAANAYRLVAHWLKILQFIAVRPSLLPDFQIWAGTRRHQNLDTWQRMPRGYLGDSTHDRTVEMLVAAGMLAREGDALVAGSRFADLKRIYDDLVGRDLLRSERAALVELARARVNKTLLKGT
jgi:hypothetical protein